MRKSLTVLLLSAVLLFTLCGCAAEGDSVSAFMLDTVVKVTVYGKDGAAAAGIQTVAAYEKKLSRTLPESEIYILNAEGGGEVSPETAALLSTALDYGELSGGLFDISIGAVSGLWGFTGEKTLPGAEEIAAACEFVDYRNVEISGNTVSMDEGMKLDLGAIAKGWIADRVAENLRAAGVSSALINLGGNIVVVGSKPGGDAWNIGIRKPFAAEGEIIGTLELRDKSIVTSGVYERYFEEGGVLYHHILDPKTGCPAETDLRSATVISDSSADGDALTTICILLGEKAALELIESLDGIEALLVLADGRIVTTSGLDSVAKFTPAG